MHLKLFVSFLAILCLGSCSTLDRSGPSLYPEMPKLQRTPCGTNVFSANGLSDLRLIMIDERIRWSLDHGVVAEPSQVTIYVKEATWYDANGTKWIDWNGQRIGGMVLKFHPITILVFPEQLGCIRHEMLHIYFWQQGQDVDYKHTRPEWGSWSDYSMT